MTVLANGLGGLQVVFDLRKVGVGIAFVDQRVEVLEGLPDAHLAAIFREILPLFLVDKIDGLMSVIQQIEFANNGRGRVVVLPELFLLLVGLIAFLDEVVPLFETGEGSHVYRLSLGERFGLYVDADVCVGAVGAFEDEM